MAERQARRRRQAARIRYRSARPASGQSIASTARPSGSIQKPTTGRNPKTPQAMSAAPSGSLTSRHFGSRNRARKRRAG